MLRSIGIGLVAGQRAMTPLAVLAAAARQGNLPDRSIASRLMANPLVAHGAVALAALEMAGEKMRTAPDRTAFLGLAARTINSAFAGAALAERERRIGGAVVAVATAITASFVGLALRKRAMRRFGQTASGFVEDAPVFGSGYAVATYGRQAG